MAFIAQNLSLIVQPVGSVGLRMFSYKTDDSQATLEAADYIPNASDYGVREDDLIFVSQVSGGADPYIMVVGSIDALDSATLVLGDPLDLGPYATEAEAIAGTNETRTMNPLRTKQAIDSRILDEDDFASDSATKVPSQQSTKAFVNNRFVATVAALATVNTSVYTQAYVLGQGAFQRVTAASYTSWIAADTTNAIIIASTHNATYAWLRVGFEHLNVLWFGAVADGADSFENRGTVRASWVTATSYAVGDLVWTGGTYDKVGYICLVAHTSGTFATDLAGAKWAAGAYSGTDNTAAFQAAIVLGNTLKMPVYIPDGKYKFAAQNLTNGGYISIAYSHVVVKGESRQGTVLLIDEDPSWYVWDNAGRVAHLFDTGTIGTPFTKDQRLASHWSNLSLRGRWSHAPGRRGVAGWRIQGCKSIVFDNVACYDIRGQLMRNTFNYSYNVRNCWAERIGAGAWRAQETDRCIVIGNTARWIDDDTIDIHSGLPFGAVGPMRSQLVVTSNILEDCEQIIGLGFRHGIVANNTVKRPKGGGIFLGLEQPQEGQGAAIGVTCSSNVVLDSIARITDGVWEGATSSAGISLSGSPRTSAGTTNAVVPGYYDSVAGAFLPPYTDNGTIPGWGAMHAGGSATYGGPGAIGHTCADNTVMRTLPEVAAFSDWGMGYYFNGAEGWLDPAMADAQFKSYGYQLQGDLYNVNFHDNKSIGIKTAGLSLIVPAVAAYDRKTAFDNVMIHHNQFIDCQNGILKDNISVNQAAADRDQWNLLIFDNLFDLDPLHRASIRNTNGTWDSDSTSAWRAIVLYNMNGCVVKGNTFRNCYDLFHANGAAESQAIISANIIHCHPAGLSYNAGNRGVAVINRPGDSYRYLFYQLDPTTPSTYRNFTGLMLTHSATMPATGYYLAGHFVQNTNPSIDASNMSILGWARITTGSAHVAATDWAICNVSHVSPAT